MTDKDYIKLILGHIGIGFLIYLFPVLAKLYAIIIVFVGLYFVIKNKNKNNEVLYAIAYIVGSEVFLRTCRGNPCHEYGKYFMLLFTILGIYYSGIPKKRNPYFLFLLLIIPGILIPIDSLSGDIKKKILFDILGPFCLGMCALYTYKREISTKELNNILIAIGLPIVACCTFLMLCYPYYNGVVNNTESNFYLSGDYAPNQMATLLGLGFFIFFLLSHLVTHSKKIIIISLLIFCCVYYRGLMTFSRGGTITGLIMIVTLLFSLFINQKDYKPLNRRIFLALLLIPALFAMASYQTDSLLYKRYANQNPTGKTKGHETNGRQDMAMEEIRFFEENPVMGLGVGKVKEIRRVEYGTHISNHSEMTRILAEHGLLGILSILILVFTPLVHYLKNKQNVYLLCFFVFWLFTINHSGMRVAAPSLIYALALLSLKKDTEISSV